MVRKASLPEKLAKLAAVSQIPLKTIVECEYLILSFQRDGTPMPSSQNTVKRLIFDFYGEKKDVVISRLSASKFISICADEWTSCSNIRYLNVVAKTLPKETFNLISGDKRIRQCTEHF